MRHSVADLEKGCLYHITQKKVVTWQVSEKQHNSVKCPHEQTTLVFRGEGERSAQSSELKLLNKMFYFSVLPFSLISSRLFHHLPPPTFSPPFSVATKQGLCLSQIYLIS